VAWFVVRQKSEGGRRWRVVGVVEARVEISRQVAGNAESTQKRHKASQAGSRHTEQREGIHSTSAGKKKEATRGGKSRQKVSSKRRQQEKAGNGR